MLRKFGRFIYYNLFFLTPLLVLSSTSELFELNKMNLIYASSASIFCIVAYAMIRQRKIVIPRLPFQIPFLLFLGSVALSSLFSIDRHLSWFGYYGRFNGGLLSLLAYGVLMYGFGYFFTAKDTRRLMRISIISSTFVMVWGLSGFMGHDLSCLLFTGSFNNSCWTDQFRPAERMFSTLGQPNWLGAYLGIHVFIGLYGVLRSQFKRWYLGYLYILLTVVCLLATKSRSALLSVAIGGALFFVILRLKGVMEDLRRERKRLLVLCGLSLIAVLLLKTGVAKIDSFLRLPSAGNKSVIVATSKASLSSEVTESLDIRKIVWTGAINLGKRYPLLGTGPETFGISYPFTRPLEHNRTSEWDYIYNKAHNEYLNFFATTGAVGLLAYLIFLVAIIRVFIRGLSSDSSEGTVFNAALVSSMISMLVTNFFGFSTSVSQLFLFLLPMLALTHDDQGLVDLVGRVTTSRIVPIQRLQIAFVIILFLFFQSWILMFFIADTQYAQALAFEANDDIITAYKHLHTAQSLHYEPMYLDKLSNYEANLALIAASQGKNDIAQRSLTQSQQHGIQVLKSSPFNVQFWKTNTKNNLVYFQLTSNPQYLLDGVKAAQTAASIAPTDPKLPYSEAVLYSVLASNADSKTEREQYTSLATSRVKRALSLKPDYDAARVFLKKLLTE